MPLFQYKAIGGDGRDFKGVVNADSLLIAKEKLRKEKVLVTSIASLDVKVKVLTLSPEQLLAFTREMAQLLKAGLPLYESLLTIEEKQKKSKNHALFVDLCDKLKSGINLSSALALYPATFPEIYLSMIKAGEQSGSLFESFDRLALLIAKQQKLKKQLLSSLAYPAFLGGFCLLIIGFLFFFIVPSMKELFEDRALHPLTHAILSISDFLNNFKLELFTLIVILCLAGVWGFRSSILRKKVSAILFKTPYIKKILLESSLVRFFRSMNMLLVGGVSLINALHFSKKMVASEVFKDLIVNTELQVQEGKKMSQLFAEAPFIPLLVIRMLSIGEETGNMSGMMQSMSEIYEEELDKDLLQLMTFLQPAVLIFLGAVVGLVVLSILLPLTDVSSFMSS